MRVGPTGFRRIRRSGALALAFWALACGDGSPSGPEGAGVPSEATGWLLANAVPVDPAAPDGDLSDLEPLRAIVGSARVVALGEATHGTREFFQLRRRMVRFLVREMGFDAVALEASLPETDRLNEWALGGSGDPEVLLSGLYGWQWNTGEVLDFVGDLRARNQVPGREPVRLYGFDMQYPGMAIRNVEAFVAEVDPDSSSEVADALECLDRFANDPAGSFPSPGYEDQLREAYRIPCRESLEEVKALLEARETEYAAASSPAAFERALRSAVLLLQFEEYASALEGRVRDRSMAENVEWILDRLGPEGRLVLWAHDDHLENVPGSMGWALRRRHGSDVLLVGFSFSRGTFNAEGPGRSAPGPWTVDGPIPGSYGHYFGSAGLPAFVLDLRGRDYSLSATRWLAGPRTLRVVGLDFDPDSPGDNRRSARLPEEFDAVVHVRESTASTLLPFRYPSEF